MTVEFDPYGFSAKDFWTRVPIMRCDTRGNLYTITPNTLPNTTPSTFAALSPSLWHEHLGHLGESILESLRLNNHIECNKTSGSSVCHSCVLGTHVKLPFESSNSENVMPFDIIHSDLWTSLVLSLMGHQYYVLFFDDYSNFLWTFPIAKKCDVYERFLASQAHIRTQFERNIKTVQCDNGRESDNGQFGKFWESSRMLFHFYYPHTSSQKW